MTGKIDIRESAAEDMAAIETLYPDAFPEEDLLPVVRDLLRERTGIVSLVAIVDRAVAGHVVFTSCGIAGTAATVSLLAPLAVASARQRQGVGGALVREGLRRAAEAGAEGVYVLGDPGYYGRFGFEPDDRVAPPYPLPPDWRDAWQSLGLREKTLPLDGKISVPPPWQRRTLWSA